MQLSVSEYEINFMKTKTVGSPIGDKEEKGRAKHLSSAALKTTAQVLIKRNKLKLKLNVKLWEFLIKSTLLYSCGTSDLTESDEDKPLMLFTRIEKNLNIT